MEKKGSLCDICHFDPGDLAVVCRGFPVKFFPLDFENKFYCFFDIGERFFPGLTLADCTGNLHALDRETAFFLGFKHHRIFHRYTLFTKEYTVFPLGSMDRAAFIFAGCVRRWGGVGFALIGRTRDRFSTEAIVKCRY